MNETQQLSREQMANIFKAALTEHQAKLGLLADIERANTTAERSVLLEDEVAQGIAYTLLAEQGASARFPLPEQQKWINNGRDAGFLIKVFKHLDRLRDDRGIKISQQRLVGHVKKAGAEANAVNLTRAHSNRGQHSMLFDIRPCSLRRQRLTQHEQAPSEGPNAAKSPTNQQHPPKADHRNGQLPGRSRPQDLNDDSWVA